VIKEIFINDYRTIIIIIGINGITVIRGKIEKDYIFNPDVKIIKKKRSVIIKDYLPEEEEILKQIVEDFEYLDFEKAEKRY